MPDTLPLAADSLHQIKDIPLVLALSCPVTNAVTHRPGFNLCPLTANGVAPTFTCLVYSKCLL